MEPDLRLDIGRKLGGGYQLKIYINQRFLVAFKRFFHYSVVPITTIKKTYRL
jgi:hypothetical protein